MLCWEGNKMRLQLDVEDALSDVARSSGRKTVIICDRGLPDSAAYVSEDDFQSILDEHDWMLDRLMARYDSRSRLYFVSRRGGAYYGGHFSWQVLASGTSRVRRHRHDPVRRDRGSPSLSARPTDDGGAPFL
jgi:hypothetical protein